MASYSEKFSRNVLGTVFAALVFVVSGIFGQSAFAAYGAVPGSDINPEILRIDESKYLGVDLTQGYPLIDAKGAEFLLEDLADKPLILIMSYYDCDGACATINNTFLRTLKEVNDWEIGKDFRALTLSFDKNDDAYSLNQFQNHVTRGKGDLPEGWTFATFKNSEDIQPFTQRMGYKFFWEPRDRVFLHPSIYVMVSPEGRVTRFLYAASVTANDIEVSITKSWGSELSASNTINFLVSACYSYNYKDGKYKLNIPMFLAVGALGIGVTSIFGGAIVMKRRARREA